MRQGTTPTHTFTLPIDTELIKTVEITYAQGKEIKLQKGTADVTMEGNVIALELSQEDTFRLDPQQLLGAQVRVVLHNGTVLGGRIHLRNVHESLSKEVLR